MPQCPVPTGAGNDPPGGTSVTTKTNTIDKAVEGDILYDTSEKVFEDIQA